MMTDPQSTTDATVVTTLPLELLIVDDNAGDVRLTRSALETARINIRVSVARDGEEAMAYLQRTGRFSAAARPDLVLLDINLPRLSGLEVLQRARSDDALHDLPIIMVTGSDADLDISAATRWAATAYITKPVSAQDVLAAVRGVDPRWAEDSVPAVLPAPPAATRAKGREHNEPGQPVMLLVEDSAGDAGLVERCLRDDPASPWTLVWVTRLAAAIELLASRPVAVIVLDLSLPDEHGLAGLARLREAAPHTPIVVLTGLDDEPTADAAIRAGAQDYLTKDRITGEALSRAARYAVERQRLEAAVARAEWLTGVAETTLAVAHGLNNPLMALLGNIELLSDDTTVAEMRETLAEVSLSAHRIADVVRRLASLKEAQTAMYIGASRMLDLSMPIPPEPPVTEHGHTS